MPRDPCYLDYYSRFVYFIPLLPFANGLSHYRKHFGKLPEVGHVLGTTPPDGWSYSPSEGSQAFHSLGEWGHPISNPYANVILSHANLCKLTVRPMTCLRGLPGPWQLSSQLAEVSVGQLLSATLLFDESLFSCQWLGFWCTLGGLRRTSPAFVWFHRVFWTQMSVETKLKQVMKHLYFNYFNRTLKSN